MSLATTGIECYNYLNNKKDQYIPIDKHHGGFICNIRNNVYDNDDHLIRYNLNDNGMDFKLPFGTQFHIMQSAEDADKVIQAFEYAISEGYNPESIEQEIYRQLNINPNNFTWYDKEKISRKVNEAWSSHEMENQGYYT